MQVIHLTAEEMDAFYEAPAEWLKVYIYLRRYADQSGMVGLKRTISRQALREWLEVPAGQGRHCEHARSYSVKAVRHILDQLKKRGLIRQIPAERRLVFLLPMAATGGVCPKYEGPMRGREEGPKEGPTHAPRNASNINKNNERRPDEGQKEGPTEHADEGPTSPITNKKGGYTPPHNSPPLRGGPRKRVCSATRFREWWDVYPKKVGKKQCLAKWKARNLDAMADRLIADVKRRAAHDRKWLAGYIPNPLTYINGDRWEDEIEPVIQPVTNVARAAARRDNWTPADEWLAESMAKEA